MGKEGGVCLGGERGLFDLLMDGERISGRLVGREGGVSAEVDLGMDAREGSCGWGRVWACVLEGGERVGGWDGGWGGCN